MAKEAPPRVPGDRLLPALSDPDAPGKPAARLSRIDTSENSEIYKALKAGGCTRSPGDLSIICDLTNKIEWALRFHVSDKSFAMEPAKFRSELRELAKRLSAFADGYPPAGSVLGRALKEALSRDEEKYRSAASEISAETDFDPERLVDRVRSGAFMWRLGNLSAKRAGADAIPIEPLTYS